MVAADADRVELGHVLAGIPEDIGDDPHAWFWWINIGVANHEFLKDIILNGSA